MAIRCAELIVNAEMFENKKAVLRRLFAFLCWQRTRFKRRPILREQDQPG